MTDSYHDPELRCADVVEAELATANVRLGQNPRQAKKQPCSFLGELNEPLHALTPDAGRPILHECCGLLPAAI
jgi:hypothetical protein